MGKPQSFVEWRDFTAGVHLPPYIKVCPLICLHIWMIGTSSECELIVQISLLNQLWISPSRALRAGGSSLLQLCFHQVQLAAIFWSWGYMYWAVKRKKSGMWLEQPYSHHLGPGYKWKLVGLLEKHWTCTGKVRFSCRAFGNSFLVLWFPIVPFWNSAYFLFFLTIRIVVTSLFNLKDKCLTLGSSAAWKHL